MGDFVANFKREDTGIHTVEGNVAGGRAASLTKERTKNQAAFEEKKSLLKASTAHSLKKVDDKFSSSTLTAKSSEVVFKASTVGLCSAKDYGEALLKSERRMSYDETEAVAVVVKKVKKSKGEKMLKRKMLSTLSFGGDEEEGEEEEENNIMAKTKASKKDPTVETSFLPDKARESAAVQAELKLKREWHASQKLIKAEPLQITYSYWDGSGHRKDITILKGTTIGEFLTLVRKDLIATGEFRELSRVSDGDLIYVKEDLIIPQDITFYDLISTRARGKSGPLFSFDVHDDIRIGAIDSRVEKDESHPGKILERAYYEKHKHLFPQSRWENFNPSKEYMEGYTVHGGEVNGKE